MLVFGSGIPAAFRRGGDFPASPGKSDVARHRPLLKHLRRAEEWCLRAARQAEVAERDREMVEMRILFLVLAVTCRFQASALVKHLGIDDHFDSAPHAPQSLVLDVDGKEDSERVLAVGRTDRAVEARLLVARGARDGLAVAHELADVLADPLLAFRRRKHRADDEVWGYRDVHEMRVLDQQPGDLALHLLFIDVGADCHHVGEVADNGNVHVDLGVHPCADQADFVFRADRQFTQVRGRIGAIQAEADDDDDHGDEAGYQKRDRGVSGGLPRCLSVCLAE